MSYSIKRQRLNESLSFFSSLFVCFMTIQLVIISLPDISPQTFDNLENLAGSNPVARAQMLAKTDPRAIDVLKFWFEEWEHDKISGGKGRYNSKWFPHGPLGVESSKEVDRIIRARYLNLFEEAVSGRLNWKIKENPYENLAWILLIDQFSRNMFRGTSRAYKYDELALKAAKFNIEHGFYAYYFTGYQIIFVIYPFMHNELMESQKRCILLMKSLNEMPAFHYKFLKGMKKAFEHYQIIFMFGRFPHRNKILNRKNTTAEEAYLSKQHEEGFIDGLKW